MDNNFIERRRYPRARIDYKAVLETSSGESVNLRTRNISGSGIYFYAERRLTEFTEVSLTVALPPAGNAGELSFECTGVIVRVEDRGERGDWPFGAAVHFTEIDEDHREAICKYVDAASAAKGKKPA
jgi:c-di-GMP-binding flagellar brake protein YcgR